MKNGEFKTKHDLVIVDDKIMKVTKEDVIGGQKFGDVLWRSMVKLAAYDHEKKQNPYDPPGVIFTFGQPGGGKTFNAHAYMQSFAELCRNKGISLWAFTHSTTDYASHFQNLTANQLANLAHEVNEFPGIVLMYVADADNVFQSRKDPRLTSEQQQTLGVYFKMFDGTMIPKNGKFLTILDANYIEGIDDATKSRVFDVILELERFDKPEQFAELARRSLLKGAGGIITLPDNEWNEIGKYMLDGPLSNREIGHVIKQLRSDFVVSEDMLGKTYEQHVQYRNDFLKGITKDAILEHFDKYINTRMEIERNSREQMLADGAERFLKYLNLEAGGEHGAK